MPSTFRNKVFRLIDEDATTYRPSRIFNGAIVALIFINVFAIIFESDDGYAVEYQEIFNWIELVSVVIFGVEYIVRLATADIFYNMPTSAKPFFRYLVSPLAIVDLLAILPSVLIIVAPYTAQWGALLDFRMVRLLRTMRLLRIFKITRYSSSLRLIVDVFRDKAGDLAVTLFITLILMVISSTLMFYVEHEAQHEQFPNILSTLWWAVATLTTVGYGDVYPITGLGKLLSGVIALLGIGLVALPTGILSSAFVDRMEERKNQQIQKKEGKEADSEKHFSSKQVSSTAHVNGQYAFCPHCGKELGPDGRPLDGACLAKES